jgi:predicted aldo/keto reductase-like oxidoreductase
MDTKLADIFKNSETLRKISLQNIDMSQFNQLINSYFIPLLRMGEQRFLKQITREKLEKAKAAVEGYLYQFHSAAKALKNWIDQENYDQIKSLENKFNNAYPSLANLSFSRKAIKVLTDVSEVDVVLNGMRTPEYVEDSMGIMETERINSQKLLV